MCIIKNEIGDKITILHEINPAFILLPIFAAKKGVKVQLENLMDEYSELCKDMLANKETNNLLVSSKAVKSALEYICETCVIEGEEEKLYKLSPEKLNIWLKSKVMLILIIITNSLKTL